MKLIFTDKAWGEYQQWQDSDMRTVKKINALIKEILRHPYIGRGKPEQLRYDLAGFWSRRIDQEHRLVYRIFKDEVQIISCKHHYN